jgi:hypothetical protein
MSKVRTNGESRKDAAPQYLTIEQRDGLIITLTKEITDLRKENAGLRLENEQLRKDLHDSLPEKDKPTLCDCGHTAMYHRVTSRGESRGDKSGITIGGCMGRECFCRNYKPAHA